MYDLFSAQVQLNLDQAMLPPADVRAIQRDRNAIVRAFDNLKPWDIPATGIDAVVQEAKEASAKPKPETDDMRKARLERWAKVELRAPFDGVLVERNIHEDEIVVDNTVNLFQIANVDRLMVTAYVSGEDLPSLQALKASERRWTVRPTLEFLKTLYDPALKASERRWTVRPAQDTSVEGVIDEIGSLIDPDEHTPEWAPRAAHAVVKGYIDNKKHQLRAGQYVTATVVRPPRPVAEVVLPSSALVEEGRHSFVFIQTDAKKFLYEQRRVLVVRRGKDAVHVRAALTLEQERQGFQTVRQGEQVVTAGVIELKAILDDLKSLKR
jgi:cobalt-zinc-cadmium efflux system membrane fusion protein